VRSPGPRQPRRASPLASTCRVSSRDARRTRRRAPPFVSLAEPRPSARGIRDTDTWRAMASASFRDSIGSLGWSRRNADLPVNTAPQGGFMSSLQSLNPFGDRGYVQLPTTEGPGAPLPAPTRREEEEGWFACESTLCPCCLSPHATFPCLASRPRTSFPLQAHPTMQDMCRLCMAVSQVGPTPYPLVLSLSYSLLPRFRLDLTCGGNKG
jgi:hypothetical protein